MYVYAKPHTLNKRALMKETLWNDRQFCKLKKTPESWE